MRIAICQNKPRRLEVHENLKQAKKLIAGREFDLLVLPELFACGYLFDVSQELEQVAEKRGDGPCFEWVHKLAHEQQAHIVAGFAEKEGESIYNAAMLVSPNGLELVYRKIHLFNTEKEFFTAGEEPAPVFALPDGTCIGIMVCFDWAFPELARSLAMRGAELICHPSNLVLPYCQKTMVGRSIENRIFIATANRSGTDTSQINKSYSLSFTGQSQLTTPQGEVQITAAKHEAAFHIAEIDPNIAKDKYMTPNNHLFDDRKPQYYQPVCNPENSGQSTQRYQ